MTMADDLYVNKNGFKCVRSQLAKTEGRDPQEYEATKRFAANAGQPHSAEVAKLRVWAKEYE